MVCSRYPKEYRYYETILKKKCFRKLKYNVWERKTKWILLEKADYHYRVKLLQKHLHLWVTYLSRCYKKKINRRAADALYEEKLKWRGLSALRKNVEQNWTLFRISKKKFEWNLMYKCWHQWKHYVEKRLKIRDVKLLANGIREERLKIRFFYLWLFRFNEKRSLQKAYEAAVLKHEKKLKEKYLRAWKIYTNKQIYKAKIQKLSTACYEDKLKERFIRCWKRHTFQKKRYQFQMKIIQNFYESYLLKIYISRWQAAYKELKHERKMCNYNLAKSFHERKLKEKSFRFLRKFYEKKKERDEKKEEFRNIYIRIYLGKWIEKRTEKIVWNNLEKKATSWRKDFLLETYFMVLFYKYQHRMEERQEMEKVINYFNAIIIDRAFRGWREVTERKINSKNELENASEFHSRKSLKKSFEKWKKFVDRRCRKKMAATYYRFILLSRVMDQWIDYFTERKTKLEKARNLELQHNIRLMKKAFDFWKTTSDTSKSTYKTAVEFYNKSKLSKCFSTWKKFTRLKMASKYRYNRNKTALNDILIKYFIIQWFEMLSVKRNLTKKLQDFEWKQQRRSLKSYFNNWFRFAKNRKTVRQNVDTYAQLRFDIFVEVYLDLMLDAVKNKKNYDSNIELAKESEKKILTRRYLRKWLSFISWTKDRIQMCVSEDKKFDTKATSENFTSAANGSRRKPMIPGYLKAEINFAQFESSSTVFFENF